MPLDLLFPKHDPLCHVPSVHPNPHPPHQPNYAVESPPIQFKAITAPATHSHLHLQSFANPPYDPNYPCPIFDACEAARLRASLHFLVVRRWMWIRCRFKIWISRFFSSGICLFTIHHPLTSRLARSPDAFISLVYLVKLRDANNALRVKHQAQTRTTMPTCPQYIPRYLLLTLHIHPTIFTIYIPCLFFRVDCSTYMKK